jgi:integrase
MSNRIRFTQAKIEALEPPAEGRAIYYDQSRPGLGLRLFPSGRSVWFWIGKHGGRTVRETLGVYRQSPDAKVSVTPAKAWTLAKAAASKVAAGTRPTEQKRAQREDERMALTLCKVYADYCANRRVRSPRTRDSEWRCYLSRWERRRLDGLHKAEVRAWFREVTKATSPSTANRALTRLRALYSWARREMDYDGPNPTAGLAKHSERGTRRRRRLKVDELAAFFTALDAATPAMRDFFRVCLYTGQRAGNVKAMRWAELDLSGGVWAIPSTKPGEAQVVILAPQVVEVLATRQRTASGPYVFPGDSASGHMETYRKAWLAVCERAGITGMTTHDLRRSLASFAQDAGVGAAIVAAQLGHADAATTLRHYTQIGGKAQRDAIGEVLAAMLGGGQP